MSNNEIIVGIDLGTTNSEISAYVEDGPKIIGRGNAKMLPSCVGITQEGELLVGQAAKNQLLIYPEMTARSIKRKMGTNEKFFLGEKSFTPQELSALILRELVAWAEAGLDGRIRKAVITVPAYFSDAQRQATREAGALAGLEVVRILNEPTAASLAYGLDSADEEQTILVYDLGGGTFDVSVINIAGDVTEVLASHGDNHLGGDDFDNLLLEKLLREFQSLHKIDLKDTHPASYSRLRWAAEQAKMQLSFEPYANIREESLAKVDGGIDGHLEMEITREEFEKMIQPLVERTLESVSQAIADAGKAASDIDQVLLVGGSTRTPLIRKVLEERIGIPPRSDIHPDLCVALGAGVLASRLAGHDIDRVLVDVSPYSFGPSYLGELNGRRHTHCYRPIITRNTPLPITRTESYYTATPYQSCVDIEIFQGENPDAMKNILVGNFHLADLTEIEGANEVLCRMNLDINGILKVSAIEKSTGRSAHITISNALEPKSDEEVANAQERLQELFANRADWLEDQADSTFIDIESTDDDSDENSSKPLKFADALAAQAFETEEISTEPLDPEFAKLSEAAGQLLTRSREKLHDVHNEDREEMVDLHEQITEAIDKQDSKSLTKAVAELKELLFFIEG